MKYKKAIIVTFTILSLVGSTSLVSADQPSVLSPFEGTKFSEVDINNDKLISKTELVDHSKRQFSVADTDHDGALSSEELIVARTIKVSFRAKKIVQILDKNSNGMLEFDELNSAVTRRFGKVFESLDLNNDGHLNKSKFSKLRQK